MSSITEVKTVVKYNRSTKSWQAINGKVTDFPAGDDGKRQALLSALGHDYPALYAVVTDIAAMHNHKPGLVDRLIKAAQLLTKGHVLSNCRVKSQTEADVVYQTSCSGHPTAYLCSCDDFDKGMQRRAGLSQWGGVETDYGLMCKHTLAQLLAYMTGWQLADQEIPF